MNLGLRNFPVAFLVGCSLLAILPATTHAQQTGLGASIAAKGSAGGAAACASCHGVKGEGNAAANFPRLAGMGPAYLEEQLNNFADNKRQNPIMSPIAKQLTAAERKAVGAYFAALPGVAGVAPPKGDNLKSSEAGPWLALHGRWDDNLPACVQCHGPGGAGVGVAFPAIAGQSSAYLAAQMHAFKNGTRPGGPMNLMGAIAKKLSDTDIAAVADYFAGTNATPVPNKGKK